jgi:hypothetical protein
VRVLERQHIRVRIDQGQRAGSVDRLWTRKLRKNRCNPFKRMAGTTRLELATSAVTESLADVTDWNLTVLTARSYSSKGTQGNSLTGLLDPDRTQIGPDPK